ncbi:hypothetical protein HMPREF3185_00320 [Porphyromonas somerae]|uniref:Uncharacterized protein n=1 Tax=Porphyromonas somerae TaxID=322095 RepID=A0A134BDF1_9PORP|nr:hypothetical protein HMPREF3184_00320 [Porphyromonadaceae bacterium KA00676]KXB77977.1 hypothetical protein HMPREF3185_00320 [Porphyromonas somerae]
MRKTHYVKTLFSSREGLFSLLWIREICAIKRRACSVASAKHIGELGARCLSTISRGQDSRQQSPYRFAHPSLMLWVDVNIGRGTNQYKFVPLPI